MSEKDKVVSINNHLKKKTGYMGVASAEPLKQHLEQMKEYNKEQAMPYNEYIEEMSKKFILKRASTHYIRFKNDGHSNEVAHFSANDLSKSEAIHELYKELRKVGEYFNENKLTEQHMLNLLKLASSFSQQVKYMDDNRSNKYTHFLSDMEMLAELSEEKREELFGIKK